MEVITVAGPNKNARTFDCAIDLQNSELICSKVSNLITYGNDDTNIYKTKYLYSISFPSRIVYPNSRAEQPQVHLKKWFSCNEQSIRFCLAK